MRYAILFSAMAMQWLMFFLSFTSQAPLVPVMCRIMPYQRQYFLNIHNNARRNVDPPAANMLQMVSSQYDTNVRHDTVFVYSFTGVE
jgi:hypothetical protein